MDGTERAVSSGQPNGYYIPVTTVFRTTVVKRSRTVVSAISVEMPKEQKVLVWSLPLVSGLGKN